jgi:hypothetical protein
VPISLEKLQLSQFNERKLSQKKKDKIKKKIIKNKKRVEAENQRRALDTRNT